MSARSTKRLSSAILIAASLMLAGSAIGRDRPENRVGASQTAATANPEAVELKARATESKALAAKISATVDKLDKEIKDLENTTDKIQNKGDRAAVTVADKQVAAAKTFSNKLSEDAESLAKNGVKMDMNIKKLKK
jgi:hypothetical protein